MSNAANPVFDRSGKYLYFTASTNNGPSDAGIDLSSIDRATNSSVYVVVLARNGASPVPPESDDENKKKDDDAKKAEKPAADDQAEAKKTADEKTDEKKKPDAKPKPTVIDLAGIGNRILSLPIPAAQLHRPGRRQDAACCFSPRGRRSADRPRMEDRNRSRSGDSPPRSA